MNVIIPEGLDFSASEMRIEDGQLCFSEDAIKTIADASGLDYATLSPSNKCGILGKWYAQHRLRGGTPHPLADAALRQELPKIVGRN